MSKRVLCLLLAMVFVMGCAHISYLPTTSQVFSPTASVEILWEKPEKAHIDLGRISTAGSEREESLFEKLKKKAMAIGADAIIITSTTPYTKTGGSYMYVRSVTIHRIEALAIKWK